MLPNAVVVPVRAVQMGQDGEFAYVVKQDDQSAGDAPGDDRDRGSETKWWSRRASRTGEIVVTEGQLPAGARA